MSRSFARSFLIVIAFLGSAVLVAAVSRTSSAVQGQEQTPIASAPPGDTSTPAASTTPGPAGGQAGTVTAAIGDYGDASVVSGGQWTSDTNLGGWQNLAVGEQDGGMYRAYLRFVLAGLPPGLQIDSAQLLLTPLQTGSEPVTITADVVQEDWGEGSITWNQQPLSTWQTGATTWQPGQGGPFAIDLTTAARTWYACGATSNFGVELSADLSSDWVVFASRKSQYSPLLQLTYESTNSPISCVAAPASSGSQAPSQPAPSTAGAQIGAPVISTPVPVTTNPGTSPCPTIFCLSRGSDVTTTSPLSTVTGTSSTTSTSGTSTTRPASSATAAAGP